MDPYYVEVIHDCKAYPIDLYFTATYLPAYSARDDQYYNIKAICTHWNWQVPSLNLDSHSIRHDFSNVSKKLIEQVTNMILSYFNVPEDARSSMAEKILDCARNMANNTHTNHKILYMAVVIDFHTLIYGDDDDDYDDDDYDRVVEESMEDQGHVSVPASKSSIEGLEKVKVEQEEGLINDCAICFEDFKVDAEAVHMPCLHLFHRTCIVNWLQERNVCPLCRFQMPTGDN